MPTLAVGLLGVGLCDGAPRHTTRPLPLYVAGPHWCKTPLCPCHCAFSSSLFLSWAVSFFTLSTQGDRHCYRCIHIDIHPHRHTDTYQGTSAQAHTRAPVDAQQRASSVARDCVAGRCAWPLLQGGVSWEHTVCEGYLCLYPGLDTWRDRLLCSPFVFSVRIGPIFACL